MSRPAYTGRFAPSPTGPLHRGSLATALGSWLDARCNDGHWLLRMEDTDTPRCVPGAAEDILRVLPRFGLVWDGDVLWQSRRTHQYQAALEHLQKEGHAFPCACSRKEIEAVNGPSARHQTLHYPGTCRTGIPAGKSARAIRFRTCSSATGEPVHARWFETGTGWIEENVEDRHGDFVIHRADGLWAYQLAVVVDDLAQGITHVVRGADLQDSTGRQVALMNALRSGQQAVPHYWHLPLVLNDRGEKLSKQAGALALDENRPITELNVAWQVFGLPAISADTPSQWLQKALPVWADYRRLFALQTTQQSCDRRFGADD